MKYWIGTGLMLIISAAVLAWQFKPIAVVRPLTAFLVAHGDDRQLVVTMSDGSMLHYDHKDITAALVKKLTTQLDDKHLGTMTIPPCPEPVTKVENGCTSIHFQEKYPYLGQNTHCMTITI